jgi:hypothetical protein
MEEFMDGGQIVAPACENPPPPPPLWRTSRVVEVNSPADNSVALTSTVTFSGTSTGLTGDLVAFFDGGTALADPQTDPTGDWTVTLANVADGQHAYGVVATTTCGRSVAAVHVTVSASGGGNGNGGNGGTGAG